MENNSRPKTQELESFDNWQTSFDTSEFEDPRQAYLWRLARDLLGSLAWKDMGPHRIVRVWQPEEEPGDWGNIQELTIDTPAEKMKDRIRRTLTLTENGKCTLETHHYVGKMLDGYTDDGECIRTRNYYNVKEHDENSHEQDTWLNFLVKTIGDIESQPKRRDLFRY